MGYREIKPGLVWGVLWKSKFPLLEKVGNWGAGGGARGRGRALSDFCVSSGPCLKVLGIFFVFSPAIKGFLLIMGGELLS